MADKFDYFGGIDFSGAKEPLSNLWSAIGEEVDGRLKILSVRPHAYRADLAGYVDGGWRAALGRADGRILWGTDFPLGLPGEVATALGAGASWVKQLAWVADRPADEIRSTAGEVARLPRLADGAGALAPLDLRLYKQTVEGLRWLHALREEGAEEICVRPLAVSNGASTTVIEVYPFATVRDLGLPRRRAPGRPGEMKARIASLRPYLDFSDPDCEATVATLEDAWDATIAALTAFLCRDDLDQPSRVQPHALDRIALEGWIYRPPAALA